MTERYRNRGFEPESADLISRRDFNQFLLGYLGTLGLAAIAGGAFDWQNGFPIRGRGLRELKKWSGYQDSDQEQLAVTQVTKAEELSTLPDNTTVEIKVPELRAIVRLAEPRLSPSNLHLFAARKMVNNRTPALRAKLANEIRQSLDQLNRYDWDRDTPEALDWVIRNKPFYPAYDKGYEWRMILGVGIGEKNVWGVHGLNYYEPQYQGWWGIDLVGIGDNLVHAPFDGIVEIVEDTIWGLHIDIVSPNGVWWVRLHHMVVIDQSIRRDSRVKAGQVVAYESPKTEGGKHLHLGMIFGYNRRPEDWVVVPGVASFSQQPIDTYFAENYIDGAGLSASSLDFIDKAKNG
jgi:murein DD-endopeptidase MepM/ murein hydrolase activator NlpD